MKAIVVSEYGGPEVLETVETGKPEAGPGELLVRIKAAGVNPVDTYVREGNHPTAPPLPFTPGKDGAGVVESIGEGVEKFSPGDRVYLAGSLTGTYAEYALCAEDQAWELPDRVTFEEGAGVFVPYATAYRALAHRARALSGETVLVHGASGAVGIAAIQWAKHIGLKVLGTAGSGRGRELVREIGADAVYDHASTPEFGYLDQIAEEHGGADIILEMLANRNLREDFRALKKFGRIVVIGSRGSLEFDPRLTMGKEASILGMSLFNAPPDAMSEIHGEIFKGLSAGYLKPAVARTYELSRAADAHLEVIEGRSYGKIVLLP